MIYRVIARMTDSLQPSPSTTSTTSWIKSVLYCGTSVRDARVTFHRSEPLDFGGSHGNRCRQTIFERLDDDKLDDNEVGEMEEVNISDSD